MMPVENEKGKSGRKRRQGDLGAENAEELQTRVLIAARCEEILKVRAKAVMTVLVKYTILSKKRFPG